MGVNLNMSSFGILVVQFLPIVIILAVPVVIITLLACIFSHKKQEIRCLQQQVAQLQQQVAQLFQLIQTVSPPNDTNNT